MEVCLTPGPRLFYDENTEFKAAIVIAQKIYSTNAITDERHSK
jgi:hypothetical protein